MQWLYKIIYIYVYEKQANKYNIILMIYNSGSTFIIQYYNIYKTVVIMMIIIKTTKNICIEDLVHHMGRWLKMKTLSRGKTTFKSAHRRVCLREAIASNDIDITNIYIYIYIYITYIINILYIIYIYGETFK